MKRLRGFCGMGELSNKNSAGYGAAALIRDTAVFILGFLFGGSHVIFGAYPLGIACVSLLGKSVWLGTAGVALGALTLGKDGIIYIMVAILVLLLRLVISSGQTSVKEPDSAEQTVQSTAFTEGLLLRMAVSVLGGFIVAAYEMIMRGMNYTTALFGIAMLLIPPATVFLLSSVFSADEYTQQKLIFGKGNFLSSKGLCGRELIGLLAFKLSALALIFLVSFSLKKYVFFGIDLSLIFAAFVTLFAARRFGALYGLCCGFAAALSASASYAAAYALMGAAAGGIFGFGSVYAIAAGGIALGGFSAYAGGVLSLVGALPEYLIGAALIFPLMGKVDRAESDTANATSRTVYDMVGTMALSYQNRSTALYEELQSAFHGIASATGLFEDSSGAEYEIAARFVSEVKEIADLYCEEDGELSDKLAAFILEKGLKYGTVRAFGAREKYIIIAAEDADAGIMTSAEFLKELSAAAGVRLGIPEYYRRGALSLMVATSAPTLAFESASVSRPGDSGEGSGDFALSKTFKNGTAIALVADGMGSGEDAGATARFCCDFASQILGTGVGINTLFHALNSIIGRRREECSVAIDLFSLDLITGEASFTKSGATFSYIKRGESLFRLRSATMPLGVLKQVDAERISVKVEPGDIIVMFSDGICEGAEDAPWLVELLNSVKTAELKELAENILSAAKENSPYKDDMTVVVSRVSVIQGN